MEILLPIRLVTDSLRKYIFLGEAKPSMRLINPIYFRSESVILKQPT